MIYVAEGRQALRDFFCPARFGCRKPRVVGAMHAPLAGYSAGAYMGEKTLLSLAAITRGG
ncbi:hypothetical protein OKW47_005199 [Paraburkholderia atlantica]